MRLKFFSDLFVLAPVRIFLVLFVLVLLLLLLLLFVSLFVLAVSFFAIIRWMVEWEGEKK